MTQILEFLFGGSGAPVSAASMGWQPGLVWLHAGANAVTALACLGMSAAGVVFLWRRGDLDPVPRGLGVLLIAFLLAVSLSHFASLVALWLPVHGAQGLIKAATAAVSLWAAVTVWPQLPKLLSLPSPRDLQRANLGLAETNASLETAIAARTYELEQANRRFELALSRANITVFTQDRDLRHTWIHNPAPGLTPESVAAEDGADGMAAEATALKRQVLETGVTASTMISWGRQHFDLTVSPTHSRSGAIDGVLCTAVDVTEKRMVEVHLAAMAAQVASAYRRFELALENSPITVFEQDADLRYTFIHNPPPRTKAEDYLGRTDAEILPEADQLKIVPAKRRVLAADDRETLEFEIDIGGQTRFYDLRLEPKRGPSGAVEGVIGTAVDLTERRRSERQMRLVMRELTHRSKNLLAVIQAMARKTARTAPDIDQFVRDFSSRLRAIAAAHDLLVAESWSGADIRSLLNASLLQTVDPAAPEITMDGPPLKLSPDSAQTLGLAFHELTMNAAQHGALSVPGGRVSVAWRHADSEVRLNWQEEGGPTVAPPRRRGFGRVLLEQLVGASLEGSVKLDFRPEGLICRIVFPDGRLIA